MFSLGGLDENGKNMFVVETVLEETSLVLVEESRGESELRRNTVIVSQRGFIVIVCSCAQTNIRTLIGKRRFGKHTNQSAHGVSSVQRSLRTPHHVASFDIGIVEVESRLVDKWNIVDIQTHGRRVDTRTDTADIHRGSQLGTVIGDKQIGYKSRQRLDRSHRVVAHFVLRERSRRNSLLAQTVIFLGSGDNHHFFDVYNFGSVLDQCNLCIGWSGKSDCRHGSCQRSENCTFHAICLVVL